MALTISNNSVTSICGLLVAKGLLKQESLDQAKSSSANSGKNIIGILIENNSTNEEQIAKVIADNNGLPFVSLKQNDIDVAQTKLLPESFIKTNHVLPYALNKGYVSIAIVDPAAISLAANLKLLTKLQVDFTVTTFTNLSEAFEWSGFATKPTKPAGNKDSKKKKKTKKWDSENLVTHSIKEMTMKGLSLKKMKKYHQTLRRLLMMCL